MTTDLRKLYGDYIASLNERRLGDMHLFAHDNLTFNGQPVSRADYVAAIAGHLAAVPDFHWHVEDLVIEGNNVAVRLVDHGTPVKEWLGLQPAGIKVELTEYAFYRFRDGRFEDMWYLLDYQGIEKQLSAAKQT